MIRLFDGRDKAFELIGTVEQICDYMGYDMIVDDIHDFYDLDRKIENENAGINFYHVEEVQGWKE